MQKKCLFTLVFSIVFTALVMAPLTALATNDETQKLMILEFQGPANAAGSFVFKIMARGTTCSNGIPDRLDQTTVSYDNVAGGNNPTTATEIRDVVNIGLTTALPAGYSLENVPGAGTTAGLVIRSTNKAAVQEFDICVGFDPGTGVQFIRVGAEIPQGDFNRHGIVIHQVRKDKAPGLTGWGIMILALGLAAASGIMLRLRTREAVA